MAESQIKDEELARKVDEMQNRVKNSLVEQYIACRKKQKKTQADIADMLGVARPNVTRFENGAYNPTIDMLVKMAACLDKEVEIKLVDKKTGKN